MYARGAFAGSSTGCLLGADVIPSHRPQECGMSTAEALGHVRTSWRRGRRLWELSPLEHTTARRSS